MQCDLCKTKTATVFLTQIVDGKMQKVNFCESCSKEKGVTDPTGFALADLLMGIGTEAADAKRSAGAQCPVCGFTQSDFKKTGRLGCSSCYEVFALGLGSLLKAMHKGVSHIGKIPVRAQKTRALSDRMRELQKQLDEAVSGEDYETAARVRDEIRELQNGMNLAV